MKNLVYLLLVLVGVSSAQACPNLVGNYISREQEIRMNVQQQGCEKLDLIYLSDEDPYTSSYTLDGKRYLQYEDENLKAYVTASLVENENEIEILHENLWADGSTRQKFVRRLRLETAKERTFLLDLRGQKNAAGEFIPNEQLTYVKQK